MTQQFIKYIQNRKHYWGPEFAEILDVEYREEHDQFIAMACTTMMHEIADSFRNGELREEILNHCKNIK